MYYDYRQNNSGGSFDIDDRVTVNVIIEANSAEEADAMAETKGLYFDGCDDGPDCSCCGDRWYRAWDGDGKAVPEIYSQPAAAFVSGNEFSWAGVGKPAVHIYHLDGRKETLVQP